MQAIVPVSVTEPLFISQGAGATDLAIRDRSADLGYVAAQNDLVGALWDAQRGGTLMSLMCMADKADYASPSAGACTVEYTLPDGSHEVSSSWPGRVRVAKVSPAWADIIATADGPAMTVTDRWRIHSSCRLLRLQREIVMKTALAAADFCPLVIRLAPQFFDRVLPLGVGFTKDNEPPRGWLETWHSEGWYFAFSGDQAAAKDALAIAVGRLDGLRRIRYGFIPADDLPEAADPRLTGALEDELQFRFRAQCDYPAALPNMFRGVVVPGWWRPGGRRIYRPGEKLSVEVLMAVARGLSWRYAQELALCEKYGLSISFGPE
ncbi:MAG: hypothetical protein H5T86_17005, partial [Armatimonadetes bacterium]|nr:hypothetical protein [Armatimonadota bacterium]